MQYQIEVTNQNTKTVSIVKIDNGVNIDRRGFYPGQIDAVKDYTGFDDEDEAIIDLKNIWTEEVVDAYNLILQQHNPFMTEE